MPSCAGTPVGDFFPGGCPLVLYAIGVAGSLLGAGSALFEAAMPFLLMGPALGIHPLLIPVMNLIGCNAALLHPKFMAGLVAQSILEPLGHGDSSWALFYATTIIAAAFSMLLYIALKGYKISKDVSISTAEDSKSMDKKQIISLLAILVQIVLASTTSFDIGMVCATLVVVEIMLGVLTQKQALTGIVSYPTLLMIASVNILIKQVQAFGGIDLIIEILGPIMTRFTAAPIVALMSAMLSLVSSTMGVVMPTVLPLLDGFVSATGGAVTFNTLLVACISSSYMAAISPLSTGGGSTMAYIASVNKDIDTNYMFKMFMIIMGCGVLFNVVLSLVGAMGILVGLF